MQLQARMKQDLMLSLATGSSNQYKRHWQRFKFFYRNNYNDSHYGATEHQLALYVVHLRQEGLQPQTIRTHLSAISFYFNISGFKTPTNSFFVKTLLKTYTRQSQPSSSRSPVSWSLLQRILDAIQSNSTKYERHLVTSLFTLMYHALLRVSEVTHSKDNDHNLHIKHISLNTKSNKLTITFNSYKHSTTSIPLQIKATDTTFCPVSSYIRFVQLRGRSSGPLFIHKDGTPLSRSYVKDQLHSSLQLIGISQQSYNTHSFRIGKATDMHRDGESDTKIQLAGRWKSTAFKKYIKPILVKL